MNVADELIGFRDVFREARDMFYNEDMRETFVYVDGSVLRRGFTCSAIPPHGTILPHAVQTPPHSLPYSSIFPMYTLHTYSRRLWNILPQRVCTTHAHSSNTQASQITRSPQCKFLVIMSKLCLSNAQMSRVFQGVLLTCWMLPAECELCKFAKMATKSHSESLEKLREEGFNKEVTSKKIGPPYAVACLGMG
eukprot:488752-Pyramimonas_sp.AAC.1